MDAGETCLGKRIDHHDPKDEPTRSCHPHDGSEGEVVDQRREEDAHREMLGTIDANHERHVHKQQGQAKLDVELKLNRRLSFSLLTATTLHPVE